MGGNTGEVAGGSFFASVCAVPCFEWRVPVRRIASLDGIVRAIAFLTDPQESGFIDGHALVVDGGWISDGSWKRYVSAIANA